MRIVVTGANGFLGRATTAALAARDTDDSITLVDRTLAPIPDDRFRAREMDIADDGAAEAIAEAGDTVIHLAALPGGAAESNPAESRRINLHATLRLLDAMGSRSRRLVCASSIAVFGGTLPARVDDTTLPHPKLTYGAHKLMVEVALADAVRRGDVSAVALRFPGIVARPGPGDGLRSAFMSTIFHAMAENRDIVLPVGPAATMWLMSAPIAADNLVRAAFLTDAIPSVMTLPVVRTSMKALVEAIRAATGSLARISWEVDPALEAAFGAYPEIDTRAADLAGFRSDGTLAALVSTVLNKRAEDMA